MLQRAITLVKPLVMMLMGNISSLTRDNFGTNNYSGYDDNRLTVISGFTNSNYAYNVNLTSDSQKNISLGYNFLTPHKQ